jgi:hypothetical protein
MMMSGKMAVPDSWLAPRPAAVRVPRQRCYAVTGNEKAAGSTRTAALLFTTAQPLRQLLW